MDKYEYVLAELKRRSGQLPVIAENCALSKRTIINIMQGKHSPRMDTVIALYDYLKANARKKTLT